LLTLGIIAGIPVGALFAVGASPLGPLWAVVIAGLVFSASAGSGWLWRYVLTRIGIERTGAD
jgi:hypothetical protein